MRGSAMRTGWLFCYANLLDRVPAGHPLREIMAVVDKALVTAMRMSSGGCGPRSCRS